MDSHHVSQIRGNLQSDPDGDVIEKIIIGARQFWILENVIKSGLLDDLENEIAPISVTSFCDKYTYNADVTERVLNLLESIGIVSKTSTNGVWQYTNSHSASKYLAKASPMDRSCAVVGEKSYVETMLSKLPTVLKNGPPTNVSEFFSDPTSSSSTDSQEEVNRSMQNMNTKVNINELKKTAATDTTHTSQQRNDKMPQPSETNAKIFIKIMDSMIYSTQHIIPRVFDLSTHRQAVDLGGGSGLTAKLLADHYPQLSVQVFELPHIAHIAQTQFEAQTNYSQRVAFVGGDFFKDPLPPADLYILAHVLHSWSEPQIHTLLDKIFNSLPPGGELLMLEKLLNDRKDGPVIGLTVDIMMAMMSTGRERTAPEYGRMLEEHGFVNTRFQHIDGANIYDAILTTKPASV